MKVQRVEKISINQNKQNRTSFKRQWSEHVSWGANYINKAKKTNFKLFSFPDAQKVFVEIADKATVGLSGMKERIVQVMAVAGAALSINQILPKDKNSKIYEMEHKGEGIYEKNGVLSKPGDKYRYIVVDKNNNVNLVKDPYSKEQEDINGWSSIYDQSKYEWKNTNWDNDTRKIKRNTKESLRGLEKLIIDEVNIPTLSQEGTFEAALSRIDEIAEQGIATAIELLPVENTYSLQWGYDGVDKFAVNSKMGGPDKLKELIDYAHGKGLNVIMDMVPNHIGPDGDYLTQTGPYEKGAGIFGGEFNYEGKNNKYVRDYMVNAALWWANEFKVDGIRLDMTKMCGSDYLLKQIVSEVNEHNPNVFLIAEDARENKESVTRYDVEKTSHDDELEFIDTQVDFIANKGWRSTPGDIGFDSEWDFRFMHTLKNAVISGTNLETLDDRIKNSAFRVKYVMSHDEIGNEDGTRLIPKIISRYLDLYNKVSGISDADKGQKAAHAAQKICELASTEAFLNMDNDALKQAEEQIGIFSFIEKEDIIKALYTALAKQKLAFGTIMTVPGPKMFFQGDEFGDFSYFKFFRNFSNPNAEPERSEIIATKGYDTAENIARPDCILGRVSHEGLLVNVPTKLRRFNKTLVNLLQQHPALQKGNIVGTFNDYNHNVHIHHLKYGNEEILVIKNFGEGFHDKSYSYYGFPQEGVWKEIFSSDCEEFGGSDYSNKNRHDITNSNQNLSLAPNSFIILEKI